MYEASDKRTLKASQRLLLTTLVISKALPAMLWASPVWWNHTPTVVPGIQKDEKAIDIHLSWLKSLNNYTILCYTDGSKQGNS
jgi:hypothetical protein